MKASAATWTSGALLWVVGVCVVFTAVCSWPQALYPASRVAAHQDSLFSIWRISWIAHQGVRLPQHLFDANIFYPNLNTLSYSDPTLLQGLIATPLLSAGLSHVVVYNVLVLSSFVLSALACCVLVRELGGTTEAGLVAGVVFAFAPYRFQHYGHLELLWGQWIPLALTFLHRAGRTGSVADGLRAAAAIVLQLFSCLYYAVFLVTVAPIVVVPLSIVGWRRRRHGVIGAFAIAGAVVAVTAALYSLPFRQLRHDLGERSTDEIRQYSATAENYLASPPDNWAYGSLTAKRFGAAERFLFPGGVAVALAIVSLWSPLTLARATYSIVLAFSVCASFGFNGFLYRLLYHWLPPYRGLRAPARFAEIAVLAIAVLAGFGFDRVRRGASLRAATGVTVLCVGLLMAEYLTTPALMNLSSEPPAAYRMLARLADGPVAELPMPRPDTLPGADPRYEYNSIFHWKPLLNGYSGYHPSSYLQLLGAVTMFPRGDWLAQIQSSGARYVVLHQAGVSADSYTSALTQLAGRAGAQSYGPFHGEGGDDWIFDIAMIQ